MSTEDVTESKWKYWKFKLEAVEHFQGPCLLQAEEQMEHWKPQCPTLLRIG